MNLRSQSECEKQSGQGKACSFAADQRGKKCDVTCVWVRGEWFLRQVFDTYFCLFTALQSLD